MSPDGSRYDPITPWKIRAVAPVRQSQWVQTARDVIKLRGPTGKFREFPSLLPESAAR